MNDSTVEFQNDVDGSLCDELKKCKDHHKNHLSDLCLKFNELQRRLQGRELTKQDRLFSYFSNLRRLEEGEKEKIPDYVLEVYINHVEKSQEDIKVRFKEWDEMNVPDWIIAPFDLKMENSDIEFYSNRNSDMCADHEAKSLFRGLALCQYVSYVNTSNKYQNLSATVKPFSNAFPSSYMAEAGFCHANSI